MAEKTESRRISKGAGPVMVILASIGLLAACDFSEPPRKRPATNQQAVGAEEKAGAQPDEPSEAEAPPREAQTSPEAEAAPTGDRPAAIREMRPQVQMVQPRAQVKPIKIQPKTGLQLRELKRTPRVGTPAKPAEAETPAENE